MLDGIICIEQHKNWRPCPHQLLSDLSSKNQVSIPNWNYFYHHLPIFVRLPGHMRITKAAKKEIPKAKLIPQIFQFVSRSKMSGLVVHYLLRKWTPSNLERILVRTSFQSQPQTLMSRKGKKSIRTIEEPVLHRCQLLFPALSNSLRVLHR